MDASGATKSKGEWSYIEALASKASTKFVSDKIEGSSRTSVLMDTTTPSHAVIPEQGWLFRREISVVEKYTNVWQENGIVGVVGYIFSVIAWAFLSMINCVPEGFDPTWSWTIVKKEDGETFFPPRGTTEVSDVAAKAIAQKFCPLDESSVIKPLQNGNAIKEGPNKGGRYKDPVFQIVKHVDQGRVEKVELHCKCNRDSEGITQESRKVAEYTPKVFANAKEMQASLKEEGIVFFSGSTDSFLPDAVAKAATKGMQDTNFDGDSLNFVIKRLSCYMQPGKRSVIQGQAGRVFMAMDEVGKKQAGVVVSLGHKEYFSDATSPSELSETMFELFEYINDELGRGLSDCQVELELKGNDKGEMFLWIVRKGEASIQMGSIQGEEFEFENLVKEEPVEAGVEDVETPDSSGVKLVAIELDEGLALEQPKSSREVSLIDPKVLPPPEGAFVTNNKEWLNPKEIKELLDGLTLLSEEELVVDFFARMSWNDDCLTDAPELDNIQIQAIKSESGEKIGIEFNLGSKVTGEQEAAIRKVLQNFFFDERSYDQRPEVVIERDEKSSLIVKAQPFGTDALERRKEQELAHLAENKHLSVDGMYISSNADAESKSETLKKFVPSDGGSLKVNFDDLSYVHSLLSSEGVNVDGVVVKKVFAESGSQTGVSFEMMYSEESQAKTLQENLGGVFSTRSDIKLVVEVKSYSITVTIQQKEKSLEEEMLDAANDVPVSDGEDEVIQVASKVAKVTGPVAPVVPFQMQTGGYLDPSMSAGMMGMMGMFGGFPVYV